MGHRLSATRIRSRSAAKVPKPLEHDLQATCVEWLAVLEKQGKLSYIAIPNAAKRSPRLMNRLKKEGFRTGFPDLIVLIPKGLAEPVTLVAELKRPGASLILKGDQEQWQRWFRKANYNHAVINDFDKFKQWVELFV